jgi:hypothetical protein
MRQVTGAAQIWDPWGKCEFKVESEVFEVIRLAETTVSRFWAPGYLTFGKCSGVDS